MGTMKESSTSFLNGQLEQAAKNISLSQPAQSQRQMLQFVDNFQFKQSVAAAASRKAKNSPNLLFNIQNTPDYLELDYKRRAPLDLIITEHTLKKYNKIFFFVAKIKWLRLVLSSQWKFLQAKEFRSKDQKALRFLSVLRMRMQHFVDTLA